MTQSQENEAQQKEGRSSFAGLRRLIIISAGALAGIIIVIFIVTLLLAANNIDQTQVAVSILRDLMIIFLALEIILVVFALTILVLQISQLVNVLQNEVKPILENTQEAVETTKTTVTFVQKNVARPVIASTGFFAGLTSLSGNLFGLRQAARYAREEDEDDGA